jgi:hypothetical protein
MSSTKFNISILFLFLVQFSFSQNIEFGEVTKEELLEKAYPNDTTANAAILFKGQDTYFKTTTNAVSLVTTMHKRIKIYNKEAFDEATVIINLFKSGSSKERLNNLEAFTYNLVDNKIVKTELEKDQIFRSEFNYSYNQVKFTLPQIKEGSIIEFQYKIDSPFYFSIDEFVFQYNIPVKNLVAELRTPKGFNFNSVTKGYINFYPTRTEKRDARFRGLVDVLSYSLSNVPALKEEKYINNLNNYRAGVFFELVSFEKYGMKSRYYAKSWQDVAKTIGSTDDYKKQLDKTKSFDDNLDAIFSGAKSQVDRMNLIFAHVKKQITWNGNDGKYFQKGIKNALKDNKGNSADINLTLVAMLRYAGIDANPIIISTKENLIPLIPTVNRLNYVIAYAIIDDQEYFLDATDDFSDVNILPLKDYNWQGILIDNNKLQWRQVSLKEPNLGESKYVLSATLSDEGTIEGNLMSRYANHSAYTFRKYYKDKALDFYVGEKEEQLGSIEISNYVTKNTDTYEGNVLESFDFYKENAADIIDNKIYISPMLFFKTKENPFLTDKREYPIDFGYPSKNTYAINITIPEGYIVESMPEPVLMRLPDNKGEFRFAPKVLADKIYLTASVKRSSAVFGADVYLYLKEFFNQIVNKQAEQIVLIKE